MDERSSRSAAQGIGGLSAGDRICGASEGDRPWTIRTLWAGPVRGSVDVAVGIAVLREGGVCMS